MKINNIPILDPNWITGFTDGGGCFYIYLDKRKDRKQGWIFQPCFQIKLHIRDKNLLVLIKSYFGEVGTIVINKNSNFVFYKVYNLNELIRIIIPHFDKYPLVTQKRSDFLLWKNIIQLIKENKHLTKEGLIEIISLKASLNKLKLYYPDIIEVERPKVNIHININKNWIGGFFSGEGCFSVGIYKSKSHKIGYGILLQVIFTKHLRDEILFNNIKFSLGYGSRRLNLLLKMLWH